VGRERLIGLLWPEQPADSARHALSEALYVLRKELGEETFVSHGDEVALNILSEAATELARAVVAVIERLEMQQETFRVAYVGGVFEAGDVVIAPMGEAIKAVAPRAFVAPPLNPPVIGAAKLALASCEQKQQLVR